MSLPEESLGKIDKFANCLYTTLYNSRLTIHSQVVNEKEN